MTALNIGLMNTSYYDVYLISRQQWAVKEKCKAYLIGKDMMITVYTLTQKQS